MLAPLSISKLFRGMASTSLLRIGDFIRGVLRGSTYRIPEMAKFASKGGDVDTMYLLHSKAGYDARVSRL